MNTKPHIRIYIVREQNYDDGRVVLRVTFGPDNENYDDDKATHPDT